MIPGHDSYFEAYILERYLSQNNIIPFFAKLMSNARFYLKGLIVMFKFIFEMLKKPIVTECYYDNYQ